MWKKVLFITRSMIVAMMLDEATRGSLPATTRVRLTLFDLLGPPLAFFT